MPPAVGFCLAFCLCWLVTHGAQASPNLQTESQVELFSYVTNADGQSSLRSSYPETLIISATVGSPITYTLHIQNASNEKLSNVQLINVLPESALDDLACVSPLYPNSGSGWQLAAPDECQMVFSVDRIPDPLGGVTLISKTQSISWTIPSIEANSSWIASYAAKPTGLQEGGGEEFETTLYVSYRLGDESWNDTTSATVRALAKIEGRSPIRRSPSWLSSDLGGTLSSDWADFDADGDLDLALASTLGTTVYRNSEGRLELFWQDSSHGSFAVRWVDVDADQRPDLVMIGGVDSQSTASSAALKEGRNFVYRYEPQTTLAAGRFLQSQVFTSTYQLARVEPGDFNGDNRVDLVVATNAINPDCPVYLYLNNGGRFVSGTCISKAASAALGPGDVDNDDDLDLALGQFPNQIRLLVNDGSGVFTSTAGIVVDPTIQFLPYDFAWGDYDKDGFLDLAAAFPLQREIRIYRNRGTSLGQGTPAYEKPIIRRAKVFMAPLSVDWGDFDGDDYLDLAVADSPPILYSFKPELNQFTTFYQLDDDVIRGQIWSIRGIDQNNDGTLELAVTNRSGPSLLFTNVTPKIDSTLSLLPSPVGFANTPAGSVSWGDADGDGDLDLYFGAADPDAGPGSLGTKLYINESGAFAQEQIQLYRNSGRGIRTQRSAVADADANGTLDLALGSEENLTLYRSNNRSTPDGRLDVPVSALAWGDADNDGRLELLIASTDALIVYRVDLSGDEPARVFTPLWTTSATDQATSVAWGDFNRDGYLDFAVGYDGGPTLLYCNTGNNLFASNAFAVVWQSAAAPTRSVAWGDLNSDGWLDLAIGNYGAANRVIRNRGTNTSCTSTDTPHFATADDASVWSSAEISRTTSLAWTDVDNDGDWDLAVGNDGEPDQIYTNQNGQLVPQWWSAERLETTGVAWGDVDGDGDMDLAISQKGNHGNGLYINTYTTASHHSTEHLTTLSLPRQPGYLALERPGHTDNAYLHSTPEILSGPVYPTVTVQYKLYDPKGSRRSDHSGENTDSVLETRYEYSLSGGRWLPATVVDATSSVGSRAQGIGRDLIFYWDAQADRAISDHATFRITAVEASENGQSQRITSSAMSPPFRVRGTTCIWPESPRILLQQRSDPSQPWQTVDSVSTQPTPEFQFLVDDAKSQLRYIGAVGAGTGVLRFHWRFDPPIRVTGDELLSQIDGQIVQPSSTEEVLYQVDLTVTGEPCPINQARYATATVAVGRALPNRTSFYYMFLPVVSLPKADPTGSGEAEPLPEAADLAPPLPVRHLWSQIDPSGGSVQIRWELHPKHSSLTKYRIYRQQVDRHSAPAFDPERMQLLATLAPGATSYTDESGVCGALYHVTALNNGAESQPSASTIYGFPCDK